VTRTTAEQVRAVVAVMLIVSGLGFIEFVMMHLAEVLVGVAVMAAVMAAVVRWRRGRKRELADQVAQPVARET